MSVFAISDLHLSLSTDKPMDIFSGWEDYIHKIEQNWKKTVRETDTIIIAGDISWALKLEETYDDLKFIDDLPGRKIIIKGNHDLWWSTKRKVETYIQENKFGSIEILFNNSLIAENMAICGSRSWIMTSTEKSDQKVFARELLRIQRSIDAALCTGLEPIVFLHYPPICNGSVCNPIIDLLGYYNIKRCYYGHMHGADIEAKNLVDIKYKNIAFQLISCDYLNFTPLEISQN